MRTSWVGGEMVLVLAVLTGTPPLAAGGQAARPQPPPRSSAVTWPDRVLISAGGGFQTVSTTFSESHSEPLNAEESTWDARYELENNVAFLGGVGVRLWRNLLAGVSYSHFQQRGGVPITGRIPHPFFFNQFRDLEGEAPSLRHQEQALHASAVVIVPINSRLELALTGGPSFFMVKRDFVHGVSYLQEYPYDTVQFASAESRQVSESTLGAHAGADVTWLLTPRFGITFLARYSRGSVDFATPVGGSVAVDAGGLQTGVGVRIGLGSRSPAPPPSPPGRPSPYVAPPAPGEPKGLGVVISTAPVYLFPDPMRTPLATLQIGTEVRVFHEAGDWLRVEFPDPRFGPRVGYVLKKHVRVDK